MTTIQNVLRPLDLLYVFCFPAFVEAAFSIVYPGKELREAWHLRAISFYLQEMFEGRKPSHLVLNVPPRSLKTLIVSICFPAWCLIRNPSLNVVVATYGDDLSKAVARQFRQLIESDLVIRVSQGNLVSALKSSETEYQTLQGGGRFTTSVGGALTGRGADIFIIDDPLKAQEAGSEAARRAVREWYTFSARSRRNNPRTVLRICSMQRLHMDDVAGTFIEQGWPTLILPAIAEQDARFDLGGGLVHQRKKGDLLQQGWDSAEELEKIRRDEGTYVFSAQYQQNPLPAEGNLIKRANIKSYKEPPPREKCRHVYVACDPAGATGLHNDYTAIVAAGVIERDVYCLEVERGHWDCLEIARRMADLAKRHRATQVMIETTGQGEAVRQELARHGRFEIRGIHQKLDKVARLYQVINRFEGGRVFLPQQAHWLLDFEKELYGFPGVKNDDQLDALIMVLEDLKNREETELQCSRMNLSKMFVPRDPHRFDRFGYHTGSW